MTMMDPEDMGNLQRAMNEHSQNLRRQLESAIDSELRLLEATLKMGDLDIRQAIIGEVFDALHYTYISNRELAERFILENEFPRRASRWPGFFIINPTGRSEIRWVVKHI